MPRSAHHGVHDAHPEIEVVRPEGVGLGLEQHRRGGGLGIVEIGWIGEGMAEGAMRRHGGEVLAQGLLDVGMNDPDIAAEAIALGVFLAEKRIARSHFDAGQVDARRPRQGAKRGDTGADAGLEHRSPGLQGIVAARKTESIPARKPFSG